MRELVRGRAAKAGMEPGALVYVGAERARPVTVEVMDYDGGQCSERTVDSLDALGAAPAGGVRWINVSGVHDAALLQQFGERFGIHPLALEDIHNTLQRPKVEDYAAYLFIVLKMVTADRQRTAVGEQVCLILSKGLVISFQEERLPGDVFDGVRAAVRTARGRVRSSGADYLAYRLVDAVVDGYFGVLEGLGARIDDLEDVILARPGPETVALLHGLKRELIALRNSVWPLREAVTRLERDESGLIADETRVYLRDVYDHAVQVMETVETFRDMAAGMLDIYLSSVSNRLNNVMKVLTVVGTIFIPLTFLTSLYGMNFEFMPELHWRYGYPVLLGVMLVLVLGMLAVFRRRRWI